MRILKIKGRNKSSLASQDSESLYETSTIVTEQPETYTDYGRLNEASSYFSTVSTKPLSQENIISSRVGYLVLLTSNH